MYCVYGKGVVRVQSSALPLFVGEGRGTELQAAAFHKRHPGQLQAAGAGCLLQDSVGWHCEKCCQGPGGNGKFWFAFSAVVQLQMGGLG